MSATTDAYVARLLATAPEPTAEQLATLQGLLEPVLPPLVAVTEPTPLPRRTRRPLADPRQVLAVPPPDARAS